MNVDDSRGNTCYLIATNSDDFYYNSFENLCYMCPTDLILESSSVFWSISSFNNSIEIYLNNNPNAFIISSNVDIPTSPGEGEESGGNQEESDVNSNNIFAGIVDIVSYLNPFSDQFFGKKLAEFIIEGLKTLFIPGEGFFEEYLESLKEFFSGRFGFLEYPITFFTNFVDRIKNLGENGNNEIINIPEIKVPVFEVTLIPATTYDLGHLYYDKTLTNFYLLYQTILKGITYFSLIRLFMKKYNEVVQR